LAVIAALVAHVAFLQAPDFVGVALIGLHLVAMINVLLAWAWLRDWERLSDAMLRLRCSFADGLTSVFVLVGAGYSTNVEPGVIKLGGVLPLGWSCAVVVLLELMLRVHGLGKSWPSSLQRLSSLRAVLVVVGMAGMLMARLIGTEPNSLLIMLTFLLVLGLYGCWKRLCWLTHTEVTEKD